MTAHPVRDRCAELLGRAEQQQPRLAVRDRPLGLADHDRLGAGATDPAVDLAAAVTIAREPCWPDDGPCRHTTVASANSSPRRASSAACSITVPSGRRGLVAHQSSVLTGGAPETSWRWVSASCTRSGSSGMSMLRTPVSLIASITALTNAAGPADRRALADALGADRVVRAGRDDLVQLEAGRLPRGRQQVVHEVGADAVALGVEGDELHAGHGVGLGQAAHDLALDDHRVDPDAAVVDGDDVGARPTRRSRGRPRPWRCSRRTAR